MTLTKQQLGGIATAIKLRSQAVQQYNLTPNFCIFCESKIEIQENQKISEVRKKKFCNQSCAAKHNNSIKPKRIKIIKQKSEKIFTVDFKTKGELFLNRSNWQSARTAIQKRARSVFDKSDKAKKCHQCNYDKHYEVCHIQSVSSFPDETLIRDINNINNLIALCPTHHWEFDNNILSI